MGMMICEAMNKLREILTEVEGENSVCYVTEDDAETLQVALSTMRKYQKIEQIVNSNPDYIHHTDIDTYKLNSIRKVIKDGNDNITSQTKTT